MKTDRHQDGDSFDIAHADIRRSMAVGKLPISTATTPSGEQIAGLRVKFTRMVPMLDFRNPFSAATNLNGTESVFSFTGRTEIEARRVHEIELWRSRRIHHHDAAGYG